MFNDDDQAIEELLDYIFGKKPDVYCIFNCFTGYKITGSKEFIEDCIDFAYGSYELWADESKCSQIKVAQTDNIEILRNDDNEIVLALIY